MGSWSKPINFPPGVIFSKILAGVSAVAQSHIHPGHSRPQAQRFQAFVHHHRKMGPGGRFPGGDDLGHRLGKTRGIVLLVFILEATGVLAAIAFAPRRAGWFIAHHGDAAEYAGRMPGRSVKGMLNPTPVIFIYYSKNWIIVKNPTLR